MPSKLLRSLAVGGSALALVVVASAYDIIRAEGTAAIVKWNPGTVTMQIKVGTTPTLQDGTNYSTSVQAAMADWNAVMGTLQFAGNVAAAGAGVDRNGINGAFFAADIYGEAFGENTIAVTLSYRSSQAQSDGTYRRTQSDVIFNNARTWNSYRGFTQSGSLDIRRVALHELGHVLGLDHPDEAGQTLTAIMNSRISSVDRLQQDDIDGAQFLYGTPGSVTRPAHDAFAAALPITLTNNTTLITSSSTNATKEPNEPNHAPGEPGGASVWWRWTATGTGSVTAVTDGSNFDTLLASYTGTQVGALTQLAANDDVETPAQNPSPTRKRTSIITFTVTAGTVYYFAVDGWAGETGSVRLEIFFTASGGGGGSTPVTLPTATLAPQTVTTGLNASISAQLVGNATYQWQISTDGGTTWTSLANGGLYSGANSPTLTISGATVGARYRYVVTTAGGSGTSNAALLTIAPLVLPFPAAIAVDSNFNLYVGDTASDAVQLVTATGVVNIFAGLAGQTGTTDATGSAARFNDPSGVTLATNGTLTVSDTANATIRRITAGGVVTTLAGSPSARGNTDGTGAAATFRSPTGIAQDTAGNLYVADAQNHTIRRITSTGAVSTYAGAAGVSGSADGNATTARFNNPTGIAVDSNGNVFVADTTNNTIRRISALGGVVTIAGVAGVSGSSDGVGSDALFNQPSGVAVDLTGDVYVADTGNSTIRRITSLGLVSTVAGLPGVAGLKDGSGNNAWFNVTDFSLIVNFAELAS
ncbi:MAG: matrixin family metalloprotease [Candidatus Didemnitutus sp.]|nr:matrixin family metalloprotease [Candidatus Didemnitutus sp.]